MKYALYLFILLATSAKATLIEFTATNVGANTYELVYDITNDDVAVGLEEISVFYDWSVFTNISVTTSFIDWDIIAIQGDSFFGDDGFVDALTFGSAINLGDTFTNFMTVTLDCFACDFTAGQYFEVLNPNTFSVLSSGMTINNSTPPVDVPEPISFGLFISALFFLFLSRKKLNI